MMAAYSLLLVLALTLVAPWWMTRLLTTQRSRDGLGQRLDREALRQRFGHVPEAMRRFAAGRRTIWLHAVSVGETLAASRLVHELEAALGEGWTIVISTTTPTGQHLARQRFGSERVSYMPLDFAHAIRPYLDTLKPACLVLMESEVWPRMMHECGSRGIPVVVVNARVSDRSYLRSKWVRWIWSRVLRKATLWLAQTDEDARRLVEMGAPGKDVYVSGNLKYDVRPARDNAMKQQIEFLLQTSRLIVAGSTLEGEEAAILNAWRTVRERLPDVSLLIAPRHPERFEAAIQQVREGGFGFLLCSDLQVRPQPVVPGSVLILDTIGDLAAIYELASVAFVGGSLVPRGGHNPLEPAQFGVPVIMGSSYENFRDIVAKMQAAGGIRIVPDTTALSAVLLELLTDAAEAKRVGEHGREAFASEAGATARTVDALLQLIPTAKPRGQQ